VAAHARRSTCLCRFSPGANQLYRRRSEFFDHCASQQWFLDQRHWRPGGRAAAGAPASPRDAGSRALVFGAEVFVRMPLPVSSCASCTALTAAARGARYGKGLHDALSEVHKRALAGDIVGNDEAEDLRRPASARSVRLPRTAPDAARRGRGVVQRVSRRARVHAGQRPCTARRRSRCTSRPYYRRGPHRSSQAPRHR